MGIKLLVGLLERLVRVRRERIVVDGRRGFVGDVRHGRDEGGSRSGERGDVGEDPDTTTPRSMRPKDRARPSCSPFDHMKPPVSEDGSGLVTEGRRVLFSVA